MEPKEPKKDLVVHITTRLDLRGAQKVCLALANGLENTDFDSCLITSSKGMLVDKAKKNNIYLLDGLNSEISFKALITEFKAFITLIKQLKQLKRKYNGQLIIHTHSTKAGIMGRWAAYFSGIKHRIHTIHGYAFHNYQNRLIWAAIYFLELITSFITTYYICVSSEDARRGVKLFPSFSKKHSIIRAGIDYKKFVQYRPTTRPFPEFNQLFIFGTVAYLNSGKNIIDLLKAFAACYYKNSNVRLEIIGDGPEKVLIKKWIKKYNLSHIIKLHGWQENVAPIMAYWHAFTLSSLSEGLPCAIVEARLLKLPIVSYKTGGIHDIIINGKNGFLYALKDWQALSKGMLKISQDKELYYKLHNYTESFDSFTYQTMIKEHQSLYRKFL